MFAGMAMRFASAHWPRSLIAQLLGISVGSLLLVMALIAGGTAFALLSKTPVMHDDLVGLIDELEASLRFDDSGRPVSMRLSPELEQQFDLLGKDAAFRITDRQRNTLIASPEGAALDALLTATLEPSRITTTFGGVPLRVLTRAIERSAGTYFVQVGRSERIERLSLTYRSRIVLGAGAFTMVLGTLVFCALLLWTTRRIVQPLRDASAIAAEIGPRNLTARLDPTRLPSELTPLIRSFNSALERLDKGFVVQQEFLMTVAHELKTPLTLVRAEIECSNLPNREQALRDLDGMARQVHQLLHLAEVSEAQNYTLEDVDAATLVSNAAASLGRLAEHGSVCLDMSLPTLPVWVQADGGAFGILLKNLVENAIQHTAAGKVVSLKLTAEGMSIRNPGPRIPASDLVKLFDRFWRGKSELPDGAGLGLTICQEVAVAHGWRLSAHDVAEPPGTEFRVVFGNRNGSA